MPLTYPPHPTNARTLRTLGAANALVGQGAQTDELVVDIFGNWATLRAFNKNIHRWHAPIQLTPERGSILRNSYSRLQGPTTQLDVYIARCGI